MVVSHSSFQFFPPESGIWIILHIFFSPDNLFLLPIMDRYCFLGSRKIIPQVFHQLKLF